MPHMKKIDSHRLPLKTQINNYESFQKILSAPCLSPEKPKRMTLEETFYDRVCNATSPKFAVQFVKQQEF